MEQPSGQRSDHQVGDGGTSRGLAKNGHASGIAAKKPDVPLNPPQGQDLVGKSRIAGNVGVSGQAHKSQGSKPIVNLNQNHISPFQQELWSQALVATRIEGPSVDEDHYGQEIPIAPELSLRGKHCEIQAVFASRRSPWTTEEDPPVGRARVWLDTLPKS